MARTRSLLGADLSKITPQQIIQFIQAKVLFATYLFHMGELREGRHHCSSAVTMVVACGLHKIRSNHPLRLDGPLDTTVITLPEPIDSVEEGMLRLIRNPYTFIYVFQHADVGDRRAPGCLLDSFHDG